MNFKQEITKPHYDFLRTNEHLGDNIVLLTLGGSHAYGTNVEGSDIDIRGCFTKPKSSILGFDNKFEIFEERETDTTLYSFNNLIQLLLECSPATIELLGCKPEHYLYLTDIGRELIDNRHMFITQHATIAFAEYIKSQNTRLRTGLGRVGTDCEMKERKIFDSVMSALEKFNVKFANDSTRPNIELFIGDSSKPDMDCELKINMESKDFPLRDLKPILTDMARISKLYGNYLKRVKNNKDEFHINKHAMHIVRLYLEAIDIFEKGEIITHREDNKRLLLSIRHGDYMLDDGTYHSSFFELLDFFQDKLRYAIENTSIPEKPDMKRIEEFVISVNERVIRNGN